MSFKHGRGPRVRLGLATLLALGVAAAVAVPLALANTATPTTSHATWSYVNGSSGPVEVVVTGSWNWPTQSCAQGAPKGSVSHTDVNGHYAIGFAGSWNDATTPNTLTGKATNGQQVTLHVGNKMDQAIVDYCRNATASNPYPTGTYRIKHRYASLSAFRTDVPNANVCVNAYDIHQQSKTDDWNPGKNGDNTLQAHQYVLSEMCMTAAQAGGTAKPALRIVKLERVGTTGPFVRGPVSAKVGDTIYYEMVVRNTGNTTLDVTLSDAHCDSGTLAPTTAVTLAAGAREIYYCSHELTSSDVPQFVNTATALGRSASASASASSSVRATSHVVANVSGVAAAHRTVVRHRARPAKPVTAAASFTG